jgi:dienelactone hydrolase
MLAFGLLAALLQPQAHAQSPDPAQQAPDTIGTGPFPAIKEVLPSLPGYVVYRPRELKRIGPRGLGIYLFGNGACAGDGAVARMHLLEIASHGFLAIAPGGIHSGPGATPRAPRPPRNLNQGFQPETPVDALDQALAWALGESERQGSPLYGLINSDQVAVSGHSCGGLQALHTARNPRVSTVVMMNSGLFPDGAHPLAGMAPPKSALSQLRGSVLYVLGGPDDIAYRNGMDDFERIAHLPAVVVDLPVGHGGTFAQPNGGRAAAVTVDWLKWQLRGESAAAAQFRGPDCGLCNKSGVALKRKNIP